MKTVEPDKPIRRWMAAACLIALAAAPATAIVVRHDVDEAKYRALGEDYPEAVAVLPDGTGVLIAPQWVLTAAHVARMADRRPLSVETGGREYAVERVFLHPDWRDMGPHDIALMRLTEPVEGVTPVAPYNGGDEVGRTVTFVGRGDFGTGKTGPTAMDRVKRAATNVVDDADDDWLFFDFDAGEAATPLEGVSGPGDSGGPALLERDGKVWVVGVSVAADGKVGRYGVTEIYSRVSTYRDWLIEVMGLSPPP